MVWVVECTLCNSLMWNIKYAVEPCSIVESIIHFRLLRKKIRKKFHKNSKKSQKNLKFSKNFTKIRKNLKKNLKFFPASKKLMNISFTFDWLVSDLIPKKIRKVQFSKKMLSYFWAFKIDAKKLYFNIFCPRIFEKLQKKSKFQSEISIRKRQKFWKILKNFEKIILTFSDFLGIKSETNH